MSQFDKDNVEVFLGAVRKYMQVRGPMSQKELAEITDTGVSTMSRFLNQQTKELNANLIANITAKLAIPLHEIIDFVEEGYTDQFIRLVKFYKGGPDKGEGVEGPAVKRSGSEEVSQQNASGRSDDGDKLIQRLQGLSLKQKGFLTEFFNLDSDGKDLVTDVGIDIIAFLKRKGIDF